MNRPDEGVVDVFDSVFLRAANDAAEQMGSTAARLKLAKFERDQLRATLPPKLDDEQIKAMERAEDDLMYFARKLIAQFYACEALRRLHLRHRSVTARRRTVETLAQRYSAVAEELLRANREFKVAAVAADHEYFGR